MSKVQLFVCFPGENITIWYVIKTIDIFSEYDVFLENPSSVTFKIKKLDSKITSKSFQASKPKGHNRIADNVPGMNRSLLLKLTFEIKISRRVINMGGGGGGGGYEMLLQNT